MNIRIFKVGSRVALRGLELHGTGIVTKIGRDRATVRLDQAEMPIDAIGRKKRPAKDWAFQYKNLRLLAGEAA
jgi:hypothetical protein